VQLTDKWNALFLYNRVPQDCSTWQ